MPTALTHSKTGEILKQVKLSAIIDAKIAENHTTLMKLAKNIGRNQSYLYTKLKNPDQPVSLLILLSNHLQCNLFEPFINLLPEAFRITQKEKDLQAQIAGLQQQIEALTKERDIYKAIVMR